MIRSTHGRALRVGPVPGPAASLQPGEGGALGPQAAVEPGMSLIEVMIAVSVLAIAILGLLTAMPVATQATRDADEYETARHAVERKIAEIRAAGLSHADSFNGQAFAVDELTKVSDDTECGSVAVADGPDGTKEVSVLVLWRGIDKENRRVEVATLVGH